MHYLSFYCELQVAHASSPYSTCTSSLLETTLNHECNLIHARFSFIPKEKENTSAWPTTKFHKKGEHKCYIKERIMKESISTSAFPITTLNHKGKLSQAQVHCQRNHLNLNEI